MHQFVCAGCGSASEGARSNKRFCSRLCAERTHDTENRKEVNRKMREYRAGRAEHFRAVSRERSRNRTLAKKRLPPVACLSCGDEFVPRDPRQRSCSKACGVKLYNVSLDRKAMIRAQYRKHHKKRRESANRRYTHDQDYRNKMIAQTRLRRAEHPDEMRLAGDKYRAFERHQRPWAPLFRAARARARTLRMPFDLTEDWLASQWTGKCSLSGVEFDLTRKMYSPSVDRIIPALGYTKANCRFVLFAVNMFKHNGTDDDVLFISNAITTFHKGK